jgi:hypothetical protein
MKLWSGGKGHFQILLYLRLGHLSWTEILRIPSSARLCLFCEEIGGKLDLAADGRAD